MTIENILDKRTWQHDVRDGKISVLKFQGQSVVRMPYGMGRLIGDEEIKIVAHELFAKRDLETCLFEMGRGRAVYENPFVQVYEVTLPSVRKYEGMSGPDSVDFFAQKMLNIYDKLKSA